MRCPVALSLNFSNYFPIIFEFSHTVWCTVSMLLHGLVCCALSPSQLKFGVLCERRWAAFANSALYSWQIFTGLARPISDCGWENFLAYSRG